MQSWRNQKASSIRSTALRDWSSPSCSKRSAPSSRRSACAAGVASMPPRSARSLAAGVTFVRPGPRSKSRWTTPSSSSSRPPGSRSLPPRRRADAAAFSIGVLNVDKGAGETSFAVVNRLRRLTGAHRVGHAGTLDPLATGVLPILFESATRLAEFALQLQKTYVADIHLGYTTATDDAEAERVPVGDPSGLGSADLVDA